jgi:hypothetical protein
VPPSLIVGLDLHADGYPSETAPMGPVLRVLSYNAQAVIVRVEGSPGTYQILRSTDLMTWGNPGAVTIPVTAPLPTSQTPIPAASQRLYRAIGSL